MDSGAKYRFHEEPLVVIRNTIRSIMPVNFIGRILYPRQQPWRQRRQAKNLLVALGVAVAFAAIVGAIIYLRNGRMQ
jgi:hypothetical protein